MIKFDGHFLKILVAFVLSKANMGISLNLTESLSFIIVSNAHY